MKKKALDSRVYDSKSGHVQTSINSLGDSDDGKLTVSLVAHMRPGVCDEHQRTANTRTPTAVDDVAEGGFLPHRPHRSGTRHVVSGMIRV